MSDTKKRRKNRKSKRFEHALETAPFPIYEIDYKAPRFLRVNQATCKISGYTEQELLSMDPSVLLDAESAERFKDRIKRGLAGQKIDESVEFKLKAKDGHDVWTVLQVKPTYKEGKLDRALVVAYDITEHKKAGEALKASESKYHNLFTNLMDGFAYCQMIFDSENKPVDFVYLEINDAFERLTGLKRENIVGRKVSEAIPGTQEANPEIFEIYGRVAKTGNPEGFELFFKPLSMWFDIGVYSPGEGYFVAVFENITERKKAQEAVMKAKEQTEFDRKRLETILEATPAAVVIIEASNGRFSFVNKRAMQLYGFDTLGLDLKENVAKVNARRMDGTDYPIEEMPVSRSLRLGVEVHNEEMMIENAKGKTFPIVASTAPLRDVQGKITAAIVVWEDITDRKKAEEALRESESMLQNIIDGSPSFIFLKDKDGRFITINKRLEESLGMTREELRGKTDYDIFSKEVADYYRKNDRQILKTKQPMQTEEIFDSPDGKKYTLLANKFPLFNSSGEVIATCGISADITERKKAEEQLRKQAELIKLDPDAILVTKPDGIITFWSKGAEKLYGYTEQEALGHVSNTLLATRFPAGFTLANILLQIKRTGDWSGELVHRAKGGREVIVRSHWVSKFDENNELEFLESNVDVTDRVLLQERLEDKAAEVEEYATRMEELVEERTSHIKKQASLIDLSPDAIMVRGFNGTISFWSAGAEKLYGWTAKEAIGQVSHDILKTIFPVRLLNINHQIERKGSWTGELRHKTKDGREVTVESRWLAEKNKAGRIIDILESNVDVTERKKAEEKLRGLSAYSRSLIEASVDPLVTISADGKITDANKAAEVVTGCRREELIGSNFSDYFTEPEKADAGYKKVFSDGFVRDYPLAIRSKSGQVTEVLYNASVYRDEAGRVQGVFAAARDVTERNKAQAAVLSERKRLFDVLETMPAMVCLITPDYHIAFANRSFRERFGDSKGRPCYEYCWGQLEPCKFCESLVPLKTGKPHHWEVTGPDGSVIEAHDYPFTDIDGKQLVLEMDMDITARKKAEAQAIESARKLKDAERLAAIGATAGMVGHDIRNPLQAITSDVYLAESELENLPDCEAKKNICESLRETEKNIDYINKIVSDLQDYARPLSPRAQESNIKTMVEETISKQKLSAELKVAVVIDDDAQKIIADPDYLKRIISNLVLNAIQAMPDGGKLTVKGRKDKKSGDLVLTVQDTGVGIPDDVKDRLFTPMFTTKAKGQGFGLAVVKRMTEILGGTVTFESRHGKGTKFIVHLPPKEG